MKSTHRGFRGPNNFLLARPMFSSRNRTSFFRRRIDRCWCLDRSRCSKTIVENIQRWKKQRWKKQRWKKRWEHSFLKKLNVEKHIWKNIVEQNIVQKSIHIFQRAWKSRPYFFAGAPLVSFGLERRHALQGWSRHAPQRFWNFIFFFFSWPNKSW